MRRNASRFRARSGKDGNAAQRMMDRHALADAVPSSDAGRARSPANGSPVRLQDPRLAAEHPRIAGRQRRGQALQPHPTTSRPRWPPAGRDPGLAQVSPRSIQKPRSCSTPRHTAPAASRNCSSAQSKAEAPIEATRRPSALTPAITGSELKILVRARHRRPDLRQPVPFAIRATPGRKHTRPPDRCGTSRRRRKDRCFTPKDFPRRTTQPTASVRRQGAVFKRLELHDRRTQSQSSSAVPRATVCRVRTKTWPVSEETRHHQDAPGYLLHRPAGQHPATPSG